MSIGEHRCCRWITPSSSGHCCWIASARQEEKEVGETRKETADHIQEAEDEQDEDIWQYIDYSLMF